MDNSIIFVREYKIEGRDKTIPAGAVYDYVESESKYVPRDLGLPNMYRDFVTGPGSDYVIAYADGDSVRMSESGDEDEVEMRWKIEVVVNMTKSRAAEFRRSLEGFISEWQIS